MKIPVSLQINLSPGDYSYARYILPHQLSILARQVDEIILTIDTKPGKGRFAVGWDENKALLFNFLYQDIQLKNKVRIILVDYAENIKQEIAEYFFGSHFIPEKDFRGGPFYAYFYGLHFATHNLVFHLDADIFLGGGSQTWVNEAAKLFQNDPFCLFVSPLPGPPHPEDRLIGQSVINKIAPYTYQLAGASTRIFMTDKSKIKKYKLALKKPDIRNQVKAIVEGNPNAELPELIFKNLMETQGLKRIDFLGLGKGLWSLHPPYRTKTFIDNIQTIISNIELGILPEKQYGFYDIIDELCDWTEGRKKLKENRWWKRI